MRPVTFAGQEGVLRAPPGHEQIVVELPIARGFDPASGVPLVISVWQLTEQEAVTIAMTRRLRLVHWGTTIPPVYPCVADLEGVEVSFDEEGEPDDKAPSG